jgi:hypothetical protein
MGGTSDPRGVPPPWQPTSSRASRRCRSARWRLCRRRSSRSSSIGPSANSGRCLDSKAASARASPRRTNRPAGMSAPAGMNAPAETSAQAATTPAQGGRPQKARRPAESRRATRSAGPAAAAGPRAAAGLDPSVRPPASAGPAGRPAGAAPAGQEDAAWAGRVWRRAASSPAAWRPAEREPAASPRAEPGRAESGSSEVARKRRPPARAQKRTRPRPARCLPLSRRRGDPPAKMPAPMCYTPETGALTCRHRATIPEEPG